MRLFIQKRTVLFAFLIFGLLQSYDSMAQIHVGVTGGVSVNQLNNPGSLLGYSGGAYVSYDLAFLNFRGGISYSKQGGGRPSYYYFPNPPIPNSNVASQEYVNRQLIFHNVEVPLYVNVYYPGTEANAIKPRITLGFAYGYNFSAIEERDIRFQFTDNTYAVYSDDRENVRGDLVPHHFDGMAGFGVDFTQEDGHNAYLEVIFRRGINQLNNVKLARMGNLGDIYKTSVSVNFGISIF